MNPFPGLSWFTTLKSRSVTRHKGNDLGDMGIAVGLDAAIPSLDEHTLLELQARDALDATLEIKNRLTRPHKL